MRIATGLDGLARQARDDGTDDAPRAQIQLELLGWGVRLGAHNFVRVFRIGGKIASATEAETSWRRRRRRGFDF